MIDPLFEIVGLSAAFLTTSAFIPQVYKIYKEKSKSVTIKSKIKKLFDI